MRTIGNHWPRSAPRNDRVAVCAICGVPWRQSLMTVNGDGLFVCPNDNEPGMSRTELVEENIARTPEPAEEHPEPGPAVIWNHPGPDAHVDCAYRDVGQPPSTLPDFQTIYKVTF